MSPGHPLRDKDHRIDPPGALVEAMKKAVGVAPARRSSWVLSSISISAHVLAHANEGDRIAMLFGCAA